MLVAIYARGSTKGKGQDIENQSHQLREFAERQGCIYKVFTDEESGGKADRPEFNCASSAVPLRELLGSCCVEP